MVTEEAEGERLQWGLTVKKTGIWASRLNSLSGPVCWGRPAGQNFLNFSPALRAGPVFLFPNFARPALSPALGVALVSVVGQEARRCCGGCDSRA